MYGLLLTTGILGSLHCIGMCGPLALSLPVPAGKSVHGVALGRVIYHAGRLLAYMSIGLLFGALGGAIVLIGLQQWLSVIAGVLLIGMVLFKITGSGRKWRIGNRFYTWINRKLAEAFNGKKGTSMFLAGMLNGYLPCGLVYTAAAMTVSFGTPVNASLGMALFGMGTFPVMFLMSMGTSWLPGKVRLKINRYSAVFALVIGSLFILRGMNLDIKYISPKVDHHTETLGCCEPGEGDSH